MLNVCRIKEIMKDHLIRYLSIVDYINLRIATVNVISPLLPLPEHLLMERFIYRMRNEVGLDNDRLQTLTRLLCERDDFYLSGGFLLALIRGDPFDAKKQDVDFFVTEPSYQGTFIQTYDERRQVNVIPVDDLYGLSLEFLRVFDLFDLGQGRIQFIVHESKQVSRHSIQHFDIPLCRNFFSMKTGLQIFCLEDVTRGRTTIQTSSLLQRVYDLKERTRFGEIYKRNASRIDKYRKRGFDIKVQVTDKDTLRSLIPIGADLAKEQARRFDRIYTIMGMHNPPSCVFTADCRCTSEYDSVRRYCLDNFQCDCNHHQAFRSEAEAKFVIMRRETIVSEHMAFWSDKN